MFVMEALILSNIFVSTPILLERKVLNTLFTLSYCLLEVLRGSQIKLIHTLFDLIYHSRDLIFKLAVRLQQADLLETQITVAPFLSWFVKIIEVPWGSLSYCTLNLLTIANFGWSFFLCNCPDFTGSALVPAIHRIWSPKGPTSFNVQFLSKDSLNKLDSLAPQHLYCLSPFFNNDDVRA